MQVNLLIRYVLAERWWPIVHQQDYQFVLSKLETINGDCVEHCSYRAMRGIGDGATPPYLISGESEDEQANSGGWVAKVWNWLKGILQIFR